MPVDVEAPHEHVPGEDLVAVPSPAVTAPLAGLGRRTSEVLQRQDAAQAAESRPATSPGTTTAPAAGEAPEEGVASEDQVVGLPAGPITGVRAAEALTGAVTGAVSATADRPGLPLALLLVIGLFLLVQHRLDHRDPKLLAVGGPHDEDDALLFEQPVTRELVGAQA